MASALTEKGYAALSVADVVRHARVSKRTFYEHFTDREQCYLATYEAVSEAMLVRIATAADDALPVEERLRAATETYLSALEELPALTRTFFTEIQLAGPAALEARRHVHQRFADLLRMLVEQGRRGRPELRSLSADMAVALVGAINELLLVRIERGQLSALRELSPTVELLLRALLWTPSAVSAERPTARARRRGRV